MTFRRFLTPITPRTSNPTIKKDTSALRGGVLLWRSGWDSNPRAVARKLISSQPRYDHFDTAAYIPSGHRHYGIFFGRWQGVIKISNCFFTNKKVVTAANKCDILLGTSFHTSSKREVRSRCEQCGWTEARTRNRRFAEQICFASESEGSRTS